MFCNKSILVYFLAVLAVVFMMLYAWRRIYGLNCLVHILEKKLSNVQKENKELRSILNGDKPDAKNASAKEADFIMNSIFDDKCCIGGTCTVPKKPHVKQSSDATQIKIETPKKERDILSDIESMVVTNVVPDIADVSSANNDANVTNDAKDPIDIDNNDIPDHESIISTDTPPGVYNRKKLSKLNIDKLKELCTSMNLSTEGTKNTLIDRILAQ